MIDSPRGSKSWDRSDGAQRLVGDQTVFPKDDVKLTCARRDWGKAEGNYDEFRFFTGLRPSEEAVALHSFTNNSAPKYLRKSRGMALAMAPPPAGPCAMTFETYCLSNAFFTITDTS
jgi:hypothetical protein